MYSREEIQKAKKRVKAKKDFYQHLMAWVIISIFLFILNMVTTPLYWWFHFILLGWGIGVMFHYVDVFGVPDFNILSKEWEEREVDNELQRMRETEFRESSKQIHAKEESEFMS